MKKIISIIMIAIMVLSVLPVVAQESESKIVFTISEEDSQGYFTLSVKLYNLKYNAMQAVLAFDSTVIKTASFDTGELTEDNNRFMIKPAIATNLNGETLNSDISSNISTGVNYTKNLLSMGHYTNISQSVPNSLVGNDYNINAGEDGLEIYRFRFKRVGQGDIEFKVATKDMENYDRMVPRGVMIGSNGIELGYNVEFVYPDETVEGPIIVPNPTQSPTPTPIPSTNPTPSPTVRPSTGGSGGSSGSTTVNVERQKRKEGTVILQINNYAAAVEGVLKWIDGSNKLVVPYIENDRTMIPLRFISESLGAKVSWDANERKITITKDDIVVEMFVENAQYKINDKILYLDANPVIIQDRTFVPLRFFSEALGKDVKWIEASKVVIVSPKDRPWNESNSVEKALLNDALLIMSPMVRDMK